MGKGVQEGDERGGEGREEGLGGNVGDDLSEAGSEKEAVGDGDVEVTEAETEGEPDKGGQDKGREEALGIENKVVVGGGLGDHG